MTNPIFDALDARPRQALAHHGIQVSEVDRPDLQGLPTAPASDLVQELAGPDALA